MSASSWFLIYSRSVFVSIPTVLTKKPLAQKCLLPPLFSGCRSNIIKALFPFRYPINCDTDNFGGILRHIWIWSTPMLPVTTSTSLYSHNFRSISPISFRNSLYSTFRRYFGMITMWYVQSHRVCAKLFLSVLDDLLCFVCVAGKTIAIISKEAFLSSLVVLLVYSHAHSAWLNRLVILLQFASSYYIAIMYFDNRS